MAKHPAPAPTRGFHASRTQEQRPPPVPSSSTFFFIFGLGVVFGASVIAVVMS